MSTVVIATASDAPTVARLLRDFHAVSPWGSFTYSHEDSIAAAKAVLEDPNMEVLLAIPPDVMEPGSADRSEAVGMLIWAKCRAWWDRTLEFASELAWWVAPTHRGVGTKLLHAYVRNAHGAGMLFAALSVLTDAIGDGLASSLESRGWRRSEQGLMLELPQEE